MLWVVCVCVVGGACRVRQKEKESPGICRLGTMDGSDFSWMRTGRSDVRGVASDPAVDTLRCVAALVKVLLKQSFDTAASFARACGRDKITDFDLHFALKYESEAFWLRPFDDEYFSALSEEREHTYYTSDESEEEEHGGEEGEEKAEEDDEEGEENDDEEEDDDEVTEEEAAEVPSFHCRATDPDLRALHVRVLHAVRAWDAWQPTDVAKRFLRDAIERTSAVLPSYQLPE